jgi:hypothetical protein
MSQHSRSILEQALDDLKTAGRGIGHEFSAMSNEEAAKRGRRGTGPCPGLVLELALAAPGSIIINRAIKQPLEALNRWLKSGRPDNES